MKLYRCNICPLSRFISLAMDELGVEREETRKSFWEVDGELLRINPLGTLPALLIPKSGLVLTGVMAMISYLETIHVAKSGDETWVKLYGSSPSPRAGLRYVDEATVAVEQAAYAIKQRALILQLVEWFCYRLHYDVTQHIMYEKIVKIVSNGSGAAPDSRRIRAAKELLKKHLGYIAALLRDKALYIGGDTPSLADYAAAAQISVLDLTSDVTWSEWETVRRWYALIKSRKSMQKVLHDPVPTVLRYPSHYADPDF